MRFAVWDHEHCDDCCGRLDLDCCNTPGRAAGLILCDRCEKFEDIKMDVDAV